MKQKIFSSLAQNSKCFGYVPTLSGNHTGIFILNFWHNKSCGVGKEATQDRGGIFSKASYCCGHFRIAKSLLSAFFHCALDSLSLLLSLTERTHNYYHNSMSSARRSTRTGGRSKSPDGSTGEQPGLRRLVQKRLLDDVFEKSSRKFGVVLLVKSSLFPT